MLQTTSEFVEPPVKAVFTPEAQEIVDWNNNHVLKCPHLEIRDYHSYSEDFLYVGPCRTSYFYCKSLCTNCNYKNCPTR